MPLIYTGIGSRETPPEILAKMKTYGAALAELGWILRSGGANGADSAFEIGCDLREGAKEIYLPWKNFNNNSSNLYTVCDEALTLASKYHPTGLKNVKSIVKYLMGRNSYQILGKNLRTPSHLVICWTPDGCTDLISRTRATGGTGQAISIASDYGIPVFNLCNADGESLLLDFISSFT